MKLFDIFPESSFRKTIGHPVRIIRRDRTKLGEIAQIKPGCMAEMGGGAWDRYVRANPECNSQALAEFFQRNDPKIYLAMERHTGIRVLSDIAYTVAEVEDDQLEEKCAAEVLLAVIYPNVLRISDVTFCNPYQEIPEEERRYRFQYYKGLGLFPELLVNCESYCRKHAIHEITLCAAYIDLVPFFEKHGFRVDDTPTGKIAFEMKVGIPMTKALRNAA